MKILFIKPSNSSFIVQDLEILKRHFPGVVEFHYRETSALNHITSQVQLIYFLIKNIWSANLVFIWFASYYSLLPVLFAKLLNKKSLIVIGGHDAAKVPELNYGAHRRKIRSWFVSKSIDWADLLLPVSKFTGNKLFNFVNPKNRYKSTVLYNGIDTNRFHKLPNVSKKNMVISVCGTTKPSVVKIKGADFFVKIAPLLPKYQFKLYGVTGPARESFKDKLPPNLEILPYLPLDDLIKEYSRAKVACQFSRYEAFGMAIGEAMACECAPVGYNYAGTPEVINGAGYLIDELNMEKAAQAITIAIENAESLGRSARKHIEANFGTEIRELQLVKIINKLLQ